MWQKIKEFIYYLFRFRINKSDGQMNREFKDVSNYCDISEVNVTAIVSNAIATYAVSDSKATVGMPNGDESARTKKLNELIQSEMLNKKVNCMAALGSGYIATIPYSVTINGERKYFSDTLMKDRFFIKERFGDVVTSAVAITDIIKNNNHTFMRFTDYSIENGCYYIRNRAIRDNSPIDIHSVPEWEKIEEEIVIPGVSQLPIAIMANPAGKRNPDDYGKPITYGCEPVMKRIVTTLQKIDREFDKKDAKIFINRNLISKKRDDDGNLISNGFSDRDLFIQFSGDESKIDIFDPAIRESSYFAKLTNEFSLMEKLIGCSKGVLTDMITGQATATEVRRASLATFSICDQINDNYEAYLNQLAYAYNVLLNYYGDAMPDSEYILTYDRTYSLLEDSAETFAQLSECESRGLVNPARLNAFVTGQTLAQAQEEIDEVKRTAPKLKDVVGGLEE